MKDTLEAVLPIAPDVASTRRVRSTLMLASLSAIRASGHREAYEAAFVEPHRETLFTAIAGVWLPIEVALAHYAACDSLHLTPEEATAIGRATEERTRGTLLGTAVRLAKGAGATPWTVLPLLQRFWERGLEGGAVGVYKLGPKEVRVDVVKVPLCESPYFRHALRGLCGGIVDLFCTRSWVHEQHGKRPMHTASYRIQWA